MIFGLMHSERARELARVLVRLLGDLDPGQVLHRHRLGVLAGHLLHPDRGEAAVLEDGEVREQVEVLEHHADLAADVVDLLEVVGELGAVDDDAPLLVLLEPVDAADHGRLAGAGRPADDDALAAADVQVDVAQDVELAVPLVHAEHLDGGLGVGIDRRARGLGSGCRRHRCHRVWPVASRRSTMSE
jgi:hypothetical protein